MKFTVKTLQKENLYRPDGYLPGRVNCVSGDELYWAPMSRGTMWAVDDGK